MYRRFFNVNTGNALKSFDAGGGLKLMLVVPEKHITNFFGLTYFEKSYMKTVMNFILSNIPKWTLMATKWSTADRS